MYSMDILIDFFHLVASAAWIGGIIYTVVILMPSLISIDPPQRGPLQGALNKRFSILSWSCVAVLAATGLLKISFEQVFDFSSLFTTALNIKLLLVVIMILIGFYLTKVVGPKMGSLAPKPGEAPSNEFIEIQKLAPKLVKINLVLGILVLFCVGFF